MLPSHTVENYLKAIFLAQVALLPSEPLVPMGQLASALGVVPGTATTMVKALSESGLVRYEPYAGVRLTPAGEKLAARVLRRHRLIELFLVQVMGMSWTEVHDEAEHLEHAVSDRLIERIDEMLGRPSADPHGDPIPGPEGTLVKPEYDTLLTCPLGETVIVRRVSDQDSEFLRFVERHELKPGQACASRHATTPPTACGFAAPNGNSRSARAPLRRSWCRSAQIVAAFIVAILCSAAVSAQTATPAKAASAPFEIIDNSFLVEEAFNQEAGIFQNIADMVFVDGNWGFNFTQEWPASSRRSISCRTRCRRSTTETDPASAIRKSTIGISYGWRARTAGIFAARQPGGADGRRAATPRIRIAGPAGQPAVQQAGNDWYWHWNAGVTWLPRAESLDPAPNTDTRVDLMSPFLAASGIYRVRQMFNLMLESVLRFDELVDETGTRRETAFILSPGFRGGWNIGEQQLIVGAAVPITWVDGETEPGLLLYLSYELPFKKRCIEVAPRKTRISRMEGNSAGTAP